MIRPIFYRLGGFFVGVYDSYLRHIAGFLISRRVRILLIIAWTVPSVQILRVDGAGIKLPPVVVVDAMG